MTKLLILVLDFLYSDQSEPRIKNELLASLEEYFFVQFLLNNLRRNLKLIPKCDKMSRYLSENVAFERFLSSQEYENILEDMKNGLGRPATRLGHETFQFEWILWILIRGFWVNGYNILEFLYITTTYSKEVISRERVFRAIEYSKNEYSSKFTDEWEFLISSKD